ncbi:MAG: DUF4268 domain-containing protein [Dehalococcoidia bacterium]|nr:DUF4268 domain-containing protein [Dehalococcoidia bacterium]
MVGVGVPPMGRLKAVTDIRVVWQNEATQFTPWLAQPENISLLGEAIGMELEVEAQEKDVGPFRADILCKETVGGHYVLIENQIERTDHSHLGQLLTYAAGLDAVTIVWIARRFADEHRAALDWLNRATGEDINFFGLEIEVWQIGDSPYAPKFNVVSKPNQFSATVRKVADAATSLTPSQQLHFEFWTQFRDFMESRNSRVRVGKASADHWKDIAIGRTGFKLVVANGMRDNHSSCWLALTGPNSKSNYRALKAIHGPTIDEAIPGVDWREKPEQNESQLGIWRQSTPSDRSTWPELNRWFAETLEQFDLVLRPIIAELQPIEPAASLAGE